MKIYILREGNECQAFTSATLLGNTIGVAGNAIRTQLWRKGNTIHYGDKVITRVQLQANTRK